MQPMQRLTPLAVSFAAVFIALIAALGVAGAGAGSSRPAPDSQEDRGPMSKAEASSLLQRHTASSFVPNLGQWGHPARFVHRRGPLTLLLEERGWVMDLVERAPGPEGRSSTTHQQKLRQERQQPHRRTPGDGEADGTIRGVALRMTFEGDARVPESVGEERLPGHHNYFLGNDERRWRTDVPLYGSVRYLDLYPGIDLRLRERNGVPEYDLLLEPGADPSEVSVHVEGAETLSLAADGSLVMETAFGPVRQPKPKTWQLDDAGNRQEVDTRFVLLGPDRFGFEVEGWNGNTSLTIDPPLIWSTFLGAGAFDRIYALVVDASGVVTVAGGAGSYVSPSFPVTTGAYDTTGNGNADAFVSRLDPSKTGNAQLVYSTFLGGSGNDGAYDIAVDGSGVVTIVGLTVSANFPSTQGAYQTTFGGGTQDAFVSRLDPSLQGARQLLYSSFLGGSRDDNAIVLSVDAFGVATVAGDTDSVDFPTNGRTRAYDSSHNNGIDAFVTRLVLRNIGSSGLLYSTFLGGNYPDRVKALSVDSSGRITLAGNTQSTDFPWTKGAYDTTFSSAIGGDTFVTRLDPSTSNQLLYSTSLGNGSVSALHVDVNGLVTVAGQTFSSGFPATQGAYSTVFNKSSPASSDAFVSRLDPTATGAAQLVYSTFLGGGSDDQPSSLAVDAYGVVTVAGSTNSGDFPTKGAYDTTHNGDYDAFVSRLDPSKKGRDQLICSTFLGGSAYDAAYAVAVDASGVATVAGYTRSADIPATSSAFDTTYNGQADAFVSRLSMGLAFYADRHEVSITQGGTQRLTLEAGQANAGRSYWIFGSVTGTTPGVTLGSAIGPVYIPLNPDIWTRYTIALANTPLLSNTRATLDASGTAQASFNIPKSDVTILSGLVFHHAYLVYDAKNNFYMASNPVPLQLR